MLARKKSEVGPRNKPSRSASGPAALQVANPISPVGSITVFPGLPASRTVASKLGQSSRPTKTNVEAASVDDVTELAEINLFDRQVRERAAEPQEEPAADQPQLGVLELFGIG